MKPGTIYLALAIAGGVIPYVFFIEHFGTAGFGLREFVAAVFANPAAGGFTADLLISSLVFWIAIIARKKRRDGPGPALFILLNVTIGLSCALPAYLYAATRARAPAQ